MLYYFKSRRSPITYLLAATYLALLLLYLEFVAGDFLYHYTLYPLIAFLTVLFHFLFPVVAIKNPTGMKKNAYNFTLKGKGGQVLPISFPEMGICVVGLPGCGKTTCLVEPIIYRMISKGYSGIIYDYDFSPRIVDGAPSLTHVAYQSLQLHASPEDKRKFFSINFQDLTTTARINPIAPDFIKDRKKLSHCLSTLLLNLNPHLATKEDFWYKNTYSLLKSIIVFLSNCHPSHCSLPHAILLGLEDSPKLMAALARDKEASSYASPIFDAYEHSAEQLAGVMANFKVLLERLLDKALFWVLSGNEVPLVVNDPLKPLIICLGNTPSEETCIAPVLSMIISVLMGNMYGHGRNKSFLVIDELPTLILPNLAKVPAITRKYKISTVGVIQNKAQLEKAYGRLGAKEILDTFSNHFVGRSPYSSSKDISDMMGKKPVESISTTKARSEVSKTTHQKEDPITRAQEGMLLQPGEFMGHVVHPRGGFFRMQLEPLKAYDSRLDSRNFQPLPKTTTRRRKKVDIEGNFKAIQEQVKRMIAEFTI
jgi:hypothetical protein